MEKSKRILALLLSAIVVSSLFFAGCGSSGTADDNAEITDIQQNVSVGKRVFVHSSGILFFGYNNLLCSAKLEGSEITEFVVEAGMTGDIYATAVYDGYIYVSDSDGMFRYPLEGFSSGKGMSGADPLISGTLSDTDHFEIFDDRIYYLSGFALYCVPVTGGEATQLVDHVLDFEVCDNGIYVEETDGDLEFMGHDGSGDTDIGEIDDMQYFTVGGRNLYYCDDKSIKAYSAVSGKTVKLGTKSKTSVFSPPFSNGANVVFSNGDLELKLLTPDGEMDLGDADDLPEKATGFVFGSCLLYVSVDYSTLTLVNMDTGELRVYDLADELSKYIEAIENGDAKVLLPDTSQS